jgi:1-acyl-sn-glycerol-3-phosphate acyltransferase
MRDLPYRVVNRFMLGLFRVLGLRFDVRGVENLPATGGAVIASNHVSYLDFIFVGLAAYHRGRLVRFMAKKSVFTSRISGPWMRGMQHIPVDREAGAAAFADAVTALTDGELVGIFPEATISRSWELKKFKTGVSRLALEAGVPIVPMVVWGGQRIFTVDKRYSLRRGKAINVLVGKPLIPAEGARAGRVMLDLHARMTELLEEVQRDYPQQPSGPDDRWWLPRGLGGTAPTMEEAAQLENNVLAARRAKAARKAAGRAAG